MNAVDTRFDKTLQTIKQALMTLVWWYTVIMNPILAKQLKDVRAELEDKRATIATLTARVEHLEAAQAALAPRVENPPEETVTGVGPNGEAVRVKVTFADPPAAPDVSTK